MKSRNQSGQLQLRIAAEAARIMAEQGLDNGLLACRKAAERLGISDQRQLPKPAQLNQALEEYLRLFGGEERRRRLRKQRQTALDAMRSLARFRPRLVGPVLQGSGDGHSRIELHLFADTPEELVFALLEMGIPWHEGERRQTYADGRRETRPSFRFRAGESEIELVVFPPEGLRQTPLVPGDTRPLERAAPEEVQQLLALSDR